MLSDKAFTPAALIDADREALERLVQQSIHEGSSGTPGTTASLRDGASGTSSVSGSSILTKRQMVSLLAPIVCLALCVILSVTNAIPATVALFAATAVSIVLALALYFLLAREAKVVAQARTIAERLHLHPGDGKAFESDPAGEVSSLLNSIEVAATEGRMRERAITENSLDIICALSADFDIVAINPACETVWGYSPTELMGKSLLPFFLDSQNVLGMFERFRRTRQAGIAEVRVKKEDGTIGDALLVVQWSDGAQRYFCVAKDISGQKEVERLRRQLVDMVSHDLRTPLQSVVNSLYVLSSQALCPLNERALKEINVAESSATHLICLINDLLDIEKWETGKVNLQCGHIPLMPVFERSHDLVAGFARQHDIDVEMQPTELKVYADGDRLVQVIVNLVSNAVKFSPPGSAVKVTANSMGEFVEIRVIDRGRGIPVEHLESVFERYHQVEVSDGQIERGMGLGLAICKKIVESLGGTIGVESVEKEGSEFWLRIPREKR